APPSPSRPPATTAAADAARATAAAGGGAAGSAGGSAAQPHRAALLLLLLLLLLVLLPLLVEVRLGLQRLGVDCSGHCLSPQQLCEWVIQRGSPGGGGFGFMLPQRPRDCASQRCVLGRVEAAALSSSEFAVAPGAGESAADLGARDFADALGASASTATGPASIEALHTFTLHSGASRCFFRDCTTITPLAAHVPVSLADPIGGLVVARASTVLPCPAVPSGSLSRLHLHVFSTNLLRNAVLKDEWPGSGLYTLTTASAQVAESGQVVASSRVSALGHLAASCSCRVLSHQTLLWHHRLGHPSQPRLRSMHSRLLVSGLPRSLPSFPCSHAPPCLPCAEGQQRAAPHSSEFPPTTARLQTLHMDVWAPAPVGGTNQERYFLLVVDNYTRYNTVFPLQRKADVSGVLIPWIRATRRQLRERFHWDFPVLRLHSDRGGEFSSDLLAEFCRDEGIHQSFTLPASPQQNGIAELRIGLITEVSHTSMIHATAPHFLWPFAIRYAVHQLNLWPHVSEPETSPTLRWTGKVGDALVFRVWGALSLVRNAKASKLSFRTLRRVFLGFPTNAPPWQLCHPRERRVFSSHDVTFDDSVCFYKLHPHASHPVPLVPLFFVDPPPLVKPLEISSDSSGPAEGGDPAADDTAATCRSPRMETPPEGEGFGGAATGGAATGGASSGGAATRGVGSGGAATGCAYSGVAASPSGGGAVGDPAGGPGAG
ncbi:unnamed protein product, partial [Closterium sp. NIES-53]